ncbi:MAG: PD40 domain-containing protein [Phycisphaerae bacterium]|nr:PD40 domain-containing protein [Phycisphaerae bacterium]
MMTLRGCMALGCAAILFLLVGCGPQTTVRTKLVEPRPVLTEEGVRLEAARTELLAYKEVIERSPNVKSVTRITENEDPGLVLGQPVVSPTEDVLVYPQLTLKWSATQAGEGVEIHLKTQSSLYKQTIGSSAKTRITFGTRADLDPAFSADGKSIVFSGNRTGPLPTLWRINLTGAGGITKLSATATEDYAPCVGPENQAIVYNCNPPGADEPQIWVMGYNGLLPTQLREGLHPQVSPDGQRILFTRPDREGKRRQLWTMSIDGFEETQVTNNTAYDVLHGRWSPDGKRVAYASNEGVDASGKRNFDIWMMDTDGTNKTQLTTNGSHDDWPCWDREGRYIYFRSNRGGMWNVWRFEPVVSSGSRAQEQAINVGESATVGP